jgi:hypothetical protein
MVEKEYVIERLSSILRYSVQFCEMYFQRIEKQHRLLGVELLQQQGRVSADKAVSMLNNYKRINHDQPALVRAARGEWGK